MGEPPEDAGAFHETVTDESPSAVLRAVGASGVVTGVTAADAVDNALAPTELTAFTVKV
jgi:hypothetical protein